MFVSKQVVHAVFMRSAALRTVTELQIGIADIRSAADLAAVSDFLPVFTRRSCPRVLGTHDIFPELLSHRFLLPGQMHASRLVRCQKESEIEEGRKYGDDRYIVQRIPVSERRANVRNGVVCLKADRRCQSTSSSAGSQNKDVCVGKVAA